ncbi:hypothetical protein A3K72_00930 [Candidatus Woesearchaeota archaeon RBG_13_36_6]|nr:MAG: hypothetical protein A3K72_00930 [Candidatus Woesearchaeota archaeon RBG_13_36_6]
MDSIIFIFMKERSLLKIALASSLIGLLVLFFVSSKLEIEENSIKELDNLNLDQDIRVKGVVSSVKDTGSIMILDIAQPQTINVMLFKDGNISISKGDFVELNGELKEYNGKKEIIANQIEVFE